MVIFWFGSEVFENALLQEAFHQVPIFDQSVADWVLNRIPGGIECFIADEEVQIFHPFRDAAGALIADFGRLLYGNRRRNDKLGLLVRCETELCVARSHVDHASWQSTGHFAPVLIWNLQRTALPPNEDPELREKLLFETNFWSFVAEN